MEVEIYFNILTLSEMFEHMKNYEKLMKKVAKWLKNEGKLFVHIFTHKQFAYHFKRGKIFFKKYIFW